MSKPKDFISISIRFRFGNPKFGGAIKHKRYENFGIDILDIEKCLKDFMAITRYDEDYWAWRVKLKESK